MSLQSRFDGYTDDALRVEAEDYKIVGSGPKNILFWAWTAKGMKKYKKIKESQEAFLKWLETDERDLDSLIDPLNTKIYQLYPDWEEEKNDAG